MAEIDMDCHFSSERLESLAMLYMQNKDISNCTPEDLYKEYRRAYVEIKTTHTSMNNEVKANLPERVNHSKRGDTS